MMLSQTLKAHFLLLGLKKANKQQSTHGHRGLPQGVQRFAALLGMVLISPLVAVTAMLLKLESRGPVFFTQTRVGENGRHFTCYKIRSMYLPTDPKYVDPNTLASDRDGVCKKFFNDPRITKVGKVIRKLSIDELPQLWNVVKGDMSLVGPRPLLMEYLSLYSKEQYRRHELRPGVTGWAQVNGRNAISWEDKFKLDVWYVKHQSFCLDLKILFLTVKKVFRSEGINTAGQATTEPFKGNL